jgi:hypothetical protein
MQRLYGSDDLFPEGPVELPFTIQVGRADEWRRVADTSLASPDDIAESGKGTPISSHQARVKARSIVVLER